MRMTAKRRVEGGVLSAHRQRVTLARSLLALFLILFTVCHFAHAALSPDSPPAAVHGSASSPPSSPPSPMSAAAQAMAAAAVKQTEVREVPMTGSQFVVDDAAGQVEDDYQSTSPHSQSLGPAELTSQPLDSQPVSGHEQVDATVDSSTTPLTSHQQPMAAHRDGAPLQCAQPQSRRSPFSTDQSCCGSDTSTATAPLTNTSTPSASANQSLSTDRIVHATNRTIANTTTDTHIVSPTHQPLSERDNASGSERVVEQKEKKNPIAELKENVLKHIEEKKKEKEKEKKKEQQLDSDNSQHEQQQQQ